MNPRTLVWLNYSHCCAEPRVRCKQCACMWRNTRGVPQCACRWGRKGRQIPQLDRRTPTPSTIAAPEAIPDKRVVSQEFVEDIFRVVAPVQTTPALLSADTQSSTFSAWPCAFKAFLQPLTPREGKKQHATPDPLAEEEPT